MRSRWKRGRIWSESEAQYAAKIQNRYDRFVKSEALFDTDMVREGLSQENRDFWLKYNPCQRFGDVREISQICVYLASDCANFINGQEMTLTGGLEHAT